MEMMEVAELEELYIPQSAAEPVALELPSSPSPSSFQQ